MDFHLSLCWDRSGLAYLFWFEGADGVCILNSGYLTTRGGRVSSSLAYPANRDCQFRTLCNEVARLSAERAVGSLDAGLV